MTQQKRSCKKREIDHYVELGQSVGGASISAGRRCTRERRTAWGQHPFCEKSNVG